jgi:hypothetical protein
MHDFSSRTYQSSRARANAKHGSKNELLERKAAVWLGLFASIVEDPKLEARLIGILTKSIDSIGWKALSAQNSSSGYEAMIRILRVM